MRHSNKNEPLIPNFDEWDALIAAPFGKLGIQTKIVDGSLMLSQIYYAPPQLRVIQPKNDLARLAVEQCEQYFLDPLFEFDLPLMPAGTYFQNKVWERINQIPGGEMWTYGEIAKQIKSAPRAVGQACGSNPFPLIVPCHRVVSATGLGGFAHQAGEGYHRQIKSWLLRHEGAI